MSRDRYVLKLSELLGLGYMEAYNKIRTEADRSEEKFSDVARRLIAEAEQTMTK
jgi:AmiR/NasT family two-component response regulator